MCTYNISIDDALMDRVRPAFADNAAVSHWMQTQIEVLLTQMAAAMSEKTQPKQSLSARLRGIGHAPQGFDYKHELVERY